MSNLQQLGTYRLIRVLDKGGFATVYLGEDIELGTQVAIKTLHTRLTIKDIEDFRNEARLVVNLHHPHIVPVQDFGVEDGIPFLVMCYAPHGTLHHRHPRGTIVPIEEVVTYVKQIASALHYIHEQKLIHRDIKPQNMLVKSDNEIMLSDFGIAVTAHSTLTLSVEDRAGTPCYRAWQGVLRRQPEDREAQERIISLQRQSAELLRQEARLAAHAGARDQQMEEITVLATRGWGSAKTHPDCGTQPEVSFDRFNNLSAK